MKSLGTGYSRKPCVQVAYKSATYTQGTRLLLTASRTASSINSSHYQIQSPSSAHHPRKMKCCLAHRWSIRLSILFSECEERTRERGKWSDQKHDKPLPSVHKLTERKGIPCFCKLIPRHIFGVESFLTSGHIIAQSPAMAAVGKACT